MTPMDHPLEAALRLAATDPASRPAFYNALLAAEVFVIGGSQGPAGERTLQAGEQVAIQHWSKPDGSPVIPFFSSLDVLRQSIEESGNFLRLPARSLFEITQGASLVLNPRSDYGKEFTPVEIMAMLSGGMNRVPQQRVVQKETSVLLAQPARRPEAMLAALKRYFATQPSVDAAWLTLMHDASATDKPVHLIGVSAPEGERDRISREAGVVAGDTVPAGEVVELTFVDARSEGVGRHLRESVAPFYRRSWTGRLRSWFGGAAR